jgi:hypothetical protein
LKTTSRKKWRTTLKNNGKQPYGRQLENKEDDIKKNLFLIPLKFRGKPFLGLAQLSKIFVQLGPIPSSRTKAWF